MLVVECDSDSGCLITVSSTNKPFSSCDPVRELAFLQLSIAKIDIIIIEASTRRYTLRVFIKDPNKLKEFLDYFNYRKNVNSID